MNDESELSECELNYPGELSDAGLFQSPTHSDSKERNSIQHSSQLKNVTTFSKANIYSRAPLDPFPPLLNRVQCRFKQNFQNFQHLVVI